MHVGKKLFYSNIIVLSVLLTMALFLAFVFARQHQSAVQAQSSLEDLSQIHELQVLMLQADNASLQVQQFLSDISATRAQSGLDDGFKLAEENSLIFKDKIKQMRSLSSQLGLTKVLEMLDEVERDFDPYYQYGRTMATAYIEGGPEKGNTLMLDFDKRAEKNSENLERLFLMVQDISQADGGQMHANMDTVQQTIKLAVAVGILCLIVVCGVLGATSHYTQKKIVLPLEQTRDHLRKLADLFEKKVYALVQTVMQSAQQIGRSSKDLSSIAEETSEQATNVASAAEQASANVQTVAAAAEELSASVSDILKHVDKASHLANQASDQSVHTQEKVQSLASASQRIDQVLTLIASIAHKTNLLALNATIEAARAGEAGKGFAVVAGEVKTLAVQTSQATQEIAEHIHQIRQATQTTNEALAMVGQTINDINLIQNVVTQSVHAQGEAAREISSNAQEAATGTQTVTANIFGVNRASQKTGDAASDFSIEVERLLDTAVHLRQEVESFMQQVYSAS